MTSTMHETAVLSRKCNRMHHCQRSIVVNLLLRWGYGWKDKTGSKQNLQSYINKNNWEKYPERMFYFLFRRAIHIVLAAIARLV